MPPAHRGALKLGLAGLIVELLLPTAVAATLLLLAATRLPFWNLRSVTGLIVFGALLVVIGVFLSVRVDGWTLPSRRRAGAGLLLNRTGPWARLVKFVLGGVAVPIAVLVAANRVELPGHRTAMALAIAASAPAPAAPLERALGDAVLHSADAGVKVAGIRALQAAATPAARAELLRILDTDPAAVGGGPAAAVLAHALASYGAAIVPALAQRLERLGPAVRGAAAASGTSLFDRELAPGFEAVRAAIAARDPDPAARATALARLQASADELRQTIEELAPHAAGARPGVVGVAMAALRDMSPPNPAALALAWQIAAEPTWAAAVRGDALLVVGDLGDARDVAALLARLEDPSPLVQAQALRAIAAIERRTPASGG